MTFRLVIAGQKGGVGKSTIALNLATTLADRGFPVVLADTDPQSAVNLNLGKGESQYPGLAQVLTGQADTGDVILSTNHPHLRLLPKGRMAARAVPAFEQRLYREGALTDIVNHACLKNNILIFDTPAGLGMITRSVLRVATHVLTPFRPDHLNLRSMNQLMETLAFIQNEENPNLQFLGFVVNMMLPGSLNHRRVINSLRRDIPQVFETMLPYSELFEKAQSEGVPATFLGPSREAGRFRLLAEEILERLIGKEVGNEVRQLV